MTTPPPVALVGYWQQLRKPLELELAHDCADTAIVGAGIGTYAKLWAERLRGGDEADLRLALSIARGLRDYRTMPVAERRRRAAAAIDLLRRREEGQPPPPPTAKPAPVKRAAAKPRPAPRPTPPDILPVGHELLEMPLGILAPRAKWPRLLADGLNLYTVRDLLYHIPRDWVELCPVRGVPDGARVAVTGTVRRRQCDRLTSKKLQHPLYKYTLTIDDGTGEAWAFAFSSEPDHARAGKRWSFTKLPFEEGQRVLVLGKAEVAGKIVQLKVEDIYQLTDAEAGVLQPGVRLPLYPLTAGVFQSQIHRTVLRVLAALGSGESANAQIDPIPAEIRDEYGLLPLIEALTELHQPRTSQHHAEARKG